MFKEYETVCAGGVATCHDDGVRWTEVVAGCDFADDGRIGDFSWADTADWIGCAYLIVGVGGEFGHFYCFFVFDEAGWPCLITLVGRLVDCDNVILGQPLFY